MKICKKEKKRQYKWFSLFLIILAVVFLFSGFLYFCSAIQSVENELCDNLQITLDRTCDYLYYRLERTQASVETLRSVLRELLNTDSNFEQQLEEYDRIKQLMMDVLDEEVISYCRIYIAKDKIYDSQLTSTYSLNSMDDLELPTENPGPLQAWWMGTHLQSYSVLFQSEWVISYICSVRSETNFDEPGAILIADVNISELQDILYTDSKDEVFLINSSGEILISKDNSLLGKPFLTLEQMNKINAPSGRIKDGDTIYIYSQLENTDWYLITTADKTQIYMLNTDIILTLILFVIALTGIAVSLSMSLLNMHLKLNVIRIREIVNRLKDNSSDDSPQDIERLLNQNFESNLDADMEQITSILMDAISEQYKNRLAIAEYQMEALQAQIKPHFLYNTLDSIKWMILDGKNEDSTWMLNELSRFIRFSFHGDSIVPLSEEIGHIQSYLGLMQKRFTNGFDVVYELDQATSQFLIPKFSLQPLVENSLLHGILYCQKNERYIAIRSWKDSNTYGIEIEDNGNGMSEEILNHLLDISRQSGEHYGVYNVWERLMIFSKNRCQFHVSSKEGAGTCISIELPFDDTSNND